MIWDWLVSRFLCVRIFIFIVQRFFPWLFLFGWIYVPISSSRFGTNIQRKYSLFALLPQPNFFLLHCNANVVLGQIHRINMRSLSKFTMQNICVVHFCCVYHHHSLTAEVLTWDENWKWYKKNIVKRLDQRAHTISSVVFNEANVKSRCTFFHSQE